jgi:hypothetical protein
MEFSSGEVYCGDKKNESDEHQVRRKRGLALLTGIDKILGGIREG